MFRKSLTSRGMEEAAVESSIPDIEQGNRGEEKSEVGDLYLLDEPATDSFEDVKVIEKLILRAVGLAIVVWIVLLVCVFTLTPKEHIGYLQSSEREVAKIAFSMFFVSISLLAMNALLRGGGWTKRKLSGVIVAALMVKFVAIATNALLAFFPSVVMVDRITTSRVYFVRWCEWIPLSGFMTFLSEVLDLKKGKGALRQPIINALAQSLSCLCGIMFPLCKDLPTWSIVMSISMLLYLNMFPRCRARYLAARNVPKDRSFLGIERRHRIQYSFLLLKTCTFLWTMLVIMYFVNMTLHRALPEQHHLRIESLAMIGESFHDVSSKIFYLSVILEVHRKVFDLEVRSQRLLLELRRLVSVLWESSSDAILVSVRHSNGKISSMVSPSFLHLVRDVLPEQIVNSNSTKTAALMLETRAISDDPVECIESAYYVDSSVIPYDGNLEDAILMNITGQNSLTTEASSLVQTAWEQQDRNSAFGNESSLLLHHVNQMGGVCRTCEMKISPHGDNALVVVLRDVTERVKRYDAERRAHLETLARQRDAQAINRFTRHEVKNGLLASMELCDNLRSTMGSVIASVVKRISRGDFDFQDRTVMLTELSDYVRSAMSSSMTISIRELDTTLSQVLDTVLAEAMARDVIHQVYDPKLESLDIMEFLGTLTKKEESRRYPIQTKNPKMPKRFMMDCQLIRYIHRNAVSNACKYGKVGGQVLTTIDYDFATRKFEMEVINEPGEGHEEILVLGDRANEMVFAEGSRLQVHQDADSKLISSGDGAWIMSKCAQTLGGKCSIGFDECTTTFKFYCQADPAPEVPRFEDHTNFMLPEGTIGIGIDDSKVQRRLMDRILSQLGVEGKKRILLGQEPNEVYLLASTLRSLLDSDKTSKVLMLVDENLDYSGADDKQILLSGSKVMEEVLAGLSPEDESRILALIRSANDSAKDVELYAQRAHGFFPKTPARREKVQEVLMPLWTDRFGPSP